MKSTEAAKPRLRKFHIGTGQSDREIIDQFVVRRNEFNQVVEVLKDNIDADSCQHLLVIAPRGRGKTTLLVRVIAELRTNKQLSAHLLPIRLMEESQEIFTLADFWLECLYYLARSCAELDRELADELTASLAALAKDWADKTLEGRARATVLDAADRLNRKLVIMVENLQSLCDEADENFGWALRQVLQSEPQIMLLGSATSRFDALENASEPFFELFRSLTLPPLDVAECRVLWQTITGDRIDERGIRPLRILTGGSPRLMVVLAGFTRDRSLQQLMEQLVNLIDDHTEYFRGQLEELASTERRVYIALIDLWQSSTTAEIANRARLDIRTVSSLLGRLVKRGAVEVEGTGKKRTYHAAERLYSIYYKLRRDRDEAAVVRNLVHFMVTYYQGDSLDDLSRGLVTEASQSDGIREGLVRAAAELPELRALLEHHGLPLPDWSLGSEDRGIPEAVAEIRQRFESADYEAVLSLTDQFLYESTSQRSPTDSVSIAASYLWKGLAQRQLDDSTAAIKTYTSLIERFEAGEDQRSKRLVAFALLNIGDTQSELDDWIAAIETYTLLIEKFDDSEDLELQRLVAKTLANKGGALGQLGDSVGEVDTYTSLIERFHDSEDQELQRLVATALVCKGVTLGQLGDSVGEVETYTSLIERFHDSEDQELQRLVVTALVYKGVTLGQLGNSAAALESFTTVLEHFQNSEDRRLQRLVGHALLNTGIAQGRLDNSDAAIETSTLLIERYGDSEDHVFQDLVASALVTKGAAQSQLGDWGSALTSYSLLIERFSDSEDRELQLQLASALLNKGVALGQLNDSDAGLKTFTSLAERFSENEDPAIQHLVAMALFNKGVTQGKHNDWAAALDSYTSAAEHLGETQETDIQDLVAMSIGNAGKALCLLGDAEGALHKVDQLRAQAIRTDMTPALVRADWVDAMAHASLGEMNVVEQRFREICSHFDPNDDDAFRAFQENTPTLVALGAPPDLLAGVLEDNETVCDALRPLAVALRREAGETVRAPAEILEIADDIQSQIESTRKTIKR